MRQLLLLLFLTPVLGACTWVHMAPGASAVRIAPSAPTGCQKLGEVEVSVKHSIAFIERNQLRVQDELETLARNEAPSAGANAVQASGPPADGSQRFLAFQCPPR